MHATGFTPQNGVAVRLHVWCDALARVLSKIYQVFEEPLFALQISVTCAPHTAPIASDADAQVAQEEVGQSCTVQEARQSVAAGDETSLR